MFTKKKTTVARKKPATKKTSKKRGLGITEPGAPRRICETIRDGQTYVYSAHGDSRPCPYGGTPRTLGTLNGAARPKKRKTATAKKICRRVIKVEGLTVSGRLKKGYKYAKGGRIVKVTAKKAAPRRKTATRK